MSRMVEYDYLIVRAKEHPSTKNNVEFFKSLKTVDAESVVHGYWYCDDYTVRFGNPYRCSCCKEENRDTYNYCPNCGAKMDEVIK